MKKILIIQVIIALITIYEVRLINKISSSISELTRLTNVDSVINRVRIDSIELVITQKDSTIVNIKNTKTATNIYCSCPQVSGFNQSTFPTIC